MYIQDGMVSRVRIITAGSSGTRVSTYAVGAFYLCLALFATGCKEPAMTTLTAALADNDRKALQAEIDAVLSAQNPNTTTEERMESLRTWIEDQDGVLQAELNPTLMDSDPAVQQIWVTLKNDPETIRTIGILLDQKALRFNLR